MLITLGYDEREGIKFREYGKLKNGVEGKVIMFNRKKLHYIITPNGDIYNTETEMKLKTIVNTGTIEYPRINLQINDGSLYTTQLIHRLIGEAYIPNPNNLPVINHIDGDKSNNDIKNLEWTTYKENNLHAFRTGLKSHTKGKEGSDCRFATYNDTTAKRVCELLQEGVPPKMIARDLEVGYSFVIGIRNGETWTYISKDYVFPIMKETSDKYNVLDVYKLQEALRKKKGTETYRQILNRLDMEFNENTRKLAGRLYNAVKEGNDLVTFRDMSTNNTYIERAKNDKKNKYYHREDHVKPL